MIPWPLKGAFVAWGLWNGQWTPYELAQKASAAGYHWLALEIDDFGNASRWSPFRDECARFQVLPGVWSTVGGNVTMAPADSGFVIAEVESPHDLWSLSAELPNVLDVPRAIVTNLFFTPEEASPLIAAGFECLTECYIGDNPNATPERMDFEAKRRGWSRGLPVFGVYNEPLLNYGEWADEPHAVYLAENIL